MSKRFYTRQFIRGLFASTENICKTLKVYCNARKQLGGSVLSTLFRYRTEKHSSYYHVSRRSPTSSAGPAPVTPPPAPTLNFIDEEDDTKKPQPIYDQPEKITIPKEVSQWCMHTVYDSCLDRCTT